MDIIITIPKNIKWEDYEKELEKVKDGSEVINYKVNNLPKINIGDKCYIVYNGFIKGYMFIVGFGKKEFICSTTGTKWQGNFIERSGKFYKIKQIPMKGFQGFRYYKEDE